MRQNDFAAPLAKLTAEERWEDAYVFYREHQDQFTKREERLIRAGLAAQMSVPVLWRTPFLLAAVALLLQLITGGIFQNQLQDLFSFLGRSFRPYMYVASVLPLIINLGLMVMLAILCYERLVLTFQLFQRPIPWARVAAAWMLGLILAGWSVFSLIPYAKDLPLVVSERWNTGIVTKEQQEATALNNVLVSMGREPEGEYDPIPWYSNPPWPIALTSATYNRWVCDIHVDDTICRMGELQFRMTDYDHTVYPVRVEYLPNSKLVLWISCGEE